MTQLPLAFGDLCKQLEKLARAQRIKIEREPPPPKGTCPSYFKSKSVRVTVRCLHTDGHSGLHKSQEGATWGNAVEWKGE